MLPCHKSPKPSINHSSSIIFLTQVTRCCRWLSVPSHAVLPRGPRFITQPGSRRFWSHGRRKKESGKQHRGSWIFFPLVTCVMSHFSQVTCSSWHWRVGKCSPSSETDCNSYKNNTAHGSILIIFLRHLAKMLVNWFVEKLLITDSLCSCVLSLWLLFGCHYLRIWTPTT